MYTAKVSTKNQVVIPKGVREVLGIKKGDVVVFEVGKYTATLVPRPRDYVESLRGLGAEMWKGVDAQEYLRGERENW